MARTFFLSGLLLSALMLWNGVFALTVDGNNLKDPCHGTQGTLLVRAQDGVSFVCHSPLAVHKRLVMQVRSNASAHVLLTQNEDCNRDPRHWASFAVFRVVQIPRDWVWTEVLHTFGRRVWQSCATLACTEAATVPGEGEGCEIGYAIRWGSTN